jgi:prepilin-type N-terminal cleavage/methylation domain-containing protein
MLVERKVGKHQTSRGGFTLVEILVVVAIITILVALLVPAVFFAVKRAKVGRMALEVASISKALERYKLEFGEYPPDFADVQLATDPASRAVEIINGHLQSIRRRRDNAADLPMINATSRDNVLLAKLNPSNALYFWLGGLASNPEYPLMGLGERTVMLDFAKERLTDVLQARIIEGRNNNGAILSNQVRDVAAQYYPAGDPTKRPYIYYRADSYTTATNDPSQTASVRWVKEIAEQRLNANGFNYQNPPPVPYLESLNGQTNFAATDKFQVISAGLDGIYGTIQKNSGGNYVWNDATTYPTVPSGVAISKEHKDNITSFAEGAIEDRITE